MINTFFVIRIGEIKWRRKYYARYQTFEFNQAFKENISKIIFFVYRRSKWLSIDYLNKRIIELNMLLNWTLKIRFFLSSKKKFLFYLKKISVYRETSRGRVEREHGSHYGHPNNWLISSSQWLSQSKNKSTKLIE
jgi:hypothetical protein